MHDTWHLPDPSSQPEFYADVATKRLIAWIVDSLIILSLCLVAVVLTAFIGLFFLPFLFLAFGFAYRIVTLTRGSATWGMRLMAIEFRTDQGAPFDLQMATLHTIGFTVSCLLPLFQLGSIVLMLTSNRVQGLSDQILGTVCVNRRAQN